MRGLRIRILLSLAAVMLVALAPAVFAAARLTRVAFDEAAAASALGDAKVVQRFLVEGYGDAAAARAMMQGTSVESIEVVSETRPAPPRRERDARVYTLPLSGASSVVVRSRAQAEDRAAPLGRLVGLYVASFSLLLLLLSYVALTRLLVRPASALLAATRKVAAGGAWMPPKEALGSLELDELSSGIAQMAKALLAEEAALRLHVSEISEGAKRLEDAKSQLARSERLASVGRLAAGLAHEIGNPLAALLGMEDLLLEGGLEPAEEREFLVRMKAETERIHRVVRDLLDFARPESATAVGTRDASGDGRPNARREARAEVGEAACIARDLALPQKKFRTIKIAVDVAESLSAAIEPDRLVQIFLNLFLNAADALAPRESGRITVRAAEEGARVVLVVEDDGPGIPPGLLDTAFEPFVTTKGVGEGTGLGLAVCRGFVEEVGGSIAVDASHAKGARFVIKLPRGPR